MRPCHLGPSMTNSLKISSLLLNYAADFNKSLFDGVNTWLGDQIRVPREYHWESSFLNDLEIRSANSSWSYMSLRASRVTSDCQSFTRIIYFYWVTNVTKGLCHLMSLEQCKCKFKYCSIFVFLDSIYGSLPWWLWRETSVRLGKKIVTEDFIFSTSVLLSGYVCSYNNTKGLVERQSGLT